ncbi:hypothetical protein ARMSODRAFT_1022462 [Armillaria solidipes]|uniref:Uncharacterized protein n=1 Tax=Armillaria solidipes TaxID=1076256 RepID=A0A2H3BLC6_9AGAR|nr:hypothetical protein ARMSODRAFT_1022462 [Armillaria solidipes]
MAWDAGYRERGNSVDGSVWIALVWQMFSDLDARTSGDRPCSMEIKEWPEKEVCWSEKCSGCRNFAYDRLEVLERVRNSQAELPGSVQTMSMLETNVPKTRPIISVNIGDSLKYVYINLSKYPSPIQCQNPFSGLLAVQDDVRVWRYRTLNP